MTINIKSVPKEDDKLCSDEFIKITVLSKPVNTSDKLEKDKSPLEKIKDIVKEFYDTIVSYETDGIEGIQKVWNAASVTDPDIFVSNLKSRIDSEVDIIKARKLISITLIMITSLIVYTFEYYKKLDRNIVPDWKIKLLEDFHRTMVYTVGYDVENLKNKSVTALKNDLFTKETWIYKNRMFSFHNNDYGYTDKYIGLIGPSGTKEYKLDISKFIDILVDKIDNKVESNIRKFINDLEPKKIYYEVNVKTQKGIEIIKKEKLYKHSDKLEPLFEKAIAENYMKLIIGKLSDNTFTPKFELKGGWKNSIFMFDLTGYIYMFLTCILSFLETLKTGESRYLHIFFAFLRNINVTNKSKIIDGKIVESDFKNILYNQGNYNNKKNLDIFTVKSNFLTETDLYLYLGLIDSKSDIAPIVKVDGEKLISISKANEFDALINTMVELSIKETKATLVEDTPNVLAQVNYKITSKIGLSKLNKVKRNQFIDTIKTYFSDKLELDKDYFTIDIPEDKTPTAGLPEMGPIPIEIIKNVSELPELKKKINIFVDGTLNTNIQSEDLEDDIDAIIEHRVDTSKQLKEFEDDEIKDTKRTIQIFYAEQLDIPLSRILVEIKEGSIIINVTITSAPGPTYYLVNKPLAEPAPRIQKMMPYTGPLEHVKPLRREDNYYGQDDIFYKVASDILFKYTICSQEWRISDYEEVFDQLSISKVANKIKEINPEIMENDKYKLYITDSEYENKLMREIQSGVLCDQHNTYRMTFEEKFFRASFIALMNGNDPELILYVNIGKKITIEEDPCLSESSKNISFDGTMCLKDTISDQSGGLFKAITKAVVGPSTPTVVPTPIENIRVIPATVKAVGNKLIFNKDLKWTISSPSPVHVYSIYLENENTFVGTMRFDKIQNIKDKYVFTVTYTNKPDDNIILRIWIKLNTNYHKDLTYPENFLTVFSDHTPVIVKKTFMQMTIIERKDKLMSSLKGFEGIEHPNFWIRYEEKTFGYLFVRGFKMTLMNMVFQIDPL